MNRPFAWFSLLGLAVACATPGYDKNCDSGDCEEPARPSDGSDAGSSGAEPQAQARRDASLGEPTVREPVDASDGVDEGADGEVNNGAPMGMPPAPEVMEPDQGAPLPPGAAALLGRYALRTRLFAGDGPAGLVQSSHEYVWDATIRLAEDNTLALDLSLCRSHWRVASPGPTGAATLSEAELASPAYWPKRTLTVHSDGQRFYTGSVGSTPVGYDPAFPADCTGVSSAPRRPYQTWIAGDTCTCPNGDLPIRADDCRIQDTDQDGRAGVTVKQNNQGSALLVMSRWRDDTQLVGGTVQPEQRHTAELLHGTNYHVLACEPNSLSCVNSTLQSCPSRLQSARFEPLTQRSDGADWTCQNILEAMDGKALFDDVPLTFPAGCF